jgi:hypothetical protein
VNSGQFLSSEQAKFAFEILLKSVDTELLLNNFSLETGKCVSFSILFGVRQEQQEKIAKLIKMMTRHSCQEGCHQVSMHTSNRGGSSVHRIVAA